MTLDGRIQGAPGLRCTVATPPGSSVLLGRQLAPANRSEAAGAGLSIPAADLAAGVGVGAWALGSGLEAHQVGSPVRQTAIHHLALTPPTVVAENSKVVPPSSRDVRAKVDAVVESILGPATHRHTIPLRVEFQDLEGRSGFGWVAEVDGELPATFLVPVTWAGPCARSRCRASLRGELSYMRSGGASIVRRCKMFGIVCSFGSGRFVGRAASTRPVLVSKDGGEPDGPGRFAFRYNSPFKPRLLVHRRGPTT